METKYEGLWKGRTAWYVSKPFTKKQLEKMPKQFRLIIRENKYHKNNDDGTPRFIFSFVDGNAANEFIFEDRAVGHWVVSETLDCLTVYESCSCSVCGKKPNGTGAVYDYKYCPYCGALMTDDFEDKRTFWKGESVIA